MSPSSLKPFGPHPLLWLHLSGPLCALATVTCIQFLARSFIPRVPGEGEEHSPFQYKIRSSSLFYTLTVPCLLTETCVSICFISALPRKTRSSLTADTTSFSSLTLVNNVGTK